MKKTHYLLTIAMLSVAILPGAVSAQVSADVNVSVEAEVGPEGLPPRPLQNPPSIREKIRNNIETHAQNAKSNRDYRNIVLSEYASTSTRMMATSSKPFIRPLPYKNDDAPRPLASSSIKAILDIRRENRENAREYRKEQFEAQKNHVIKELDQVLSNLTQIKGRIETRIGKAEQDGHNMTDTKNLLSIANSKLTLAVQAVADLKNFNASTSITASSTVDLSKPRELLNNATKAVRTAREALNDVVVAIAKSMGFKIGLNGQITATSTTNTTTQ